MTTTKEHTMPSRKRLTHRTINGVRVCVDADYNVSVVDDSGMAVLNLGKAFPVRAKVDGQARNWQAEAGPDIRLDEPLHATQAEAISALLKHTAWVPGAQVLTTSMGPAHVGPADKDYPTLLNYENIGVAMERQRGFIERNVHLKDPGYSTKFYIGDDGSEPVYVGRLVFRGMRYVGPANGRLPVIEWEYAEGWRGPLDVQRCPVCRAEDNRQCCEYGREA